MKEIELTPQETIKELNDMCNHLDCDRNYSLAVDEACKVLDLRIPQKVDIINPMAYDTHFYIACPTCGKNLKIEASEFKSVLYCYRCGQALDLANSFK